jgi:hypothetical protein
MTEIVVPSWLPLVLLGALTVGALWLRTWITARAQAGVKAAFDKELETHKQELQQLGEANKFELQRILQEFRLFATKKHEVYAALWSAVG